MKYNQARFIGSFPDWRQAPRSGLPEIAFGGRSNVGKSSLINSLLRRRKLAQISKTPGKTRLLNYYEVLDEKGRETLNFVDLPGFGYARVSASIRGSWKQLIEEYIENSSKLRGFILLVDSRRGLEEEEVQLIEYLLSKKRPILPVLTKADKLTRQAGIDIIRHTTEALRLFGQGICAPILHSSVMRSGNDLIWRWIDERISNAGK
jgi:GTP-binding protein